MFRRFWIALLLSLPAYAYLAYGLDRTNFGLLLLSYTLPFIAYFSLITSKEISKIHNFQWMGIGFRLIFLFSIPLLSDDYFRFIWDGHIGAAGENPFLYLPTDIQGSPFAEKLGLTKELFEGMNSPDYYTVYPPVAQGIYTLSAWLSPNSIFGSILVMRAMILLAEIGTIVLLPKFLSLLNFKPSYSLLYILNPLVIVELSGNLHFEGIMIFFLLAALYFLHQEKWVPAAFLWALAAATKLIPILFLPILLRKLPFKRTVLVGGITATVFMILWLPFYHPDTFDNFFSSFQLYFKTFEFNASVYYIIRWIGFQTVGYNIIGQAGAIISKVLPILLLIIYWWKDQKDPHRFWNSLLWALSLYYFLGLIIHPWYICTLVALSVFSKSHRYAIVWSFLAILSYAAYQTEAYLENYWLITLEYLVVYALLIWELMRRSDYSSSSSFPIKI